MNQTEDRPSLANVSPAVEPRPPSSAPEESRVIRAVQDYLALMETGHKPDRKEFLGRYPEIAGALAECLAGLEFVHAAVPDLSHPPADAGTPGDILSGVPLGDFHIFREIGRGGMGIVYEAEQLSLGRRVALKVLPFAAAMDAKQLQRFKNEAQAAAQLHHTNIVPVHFVGCERGVHFYAMQFIEGQTLAAVIHDLRQLTPVATGGSPVASQQAATGEPPIATGPSGAAGSLAGELTSGRWAPAKPGRGDPRPTIAHPPDPGLAPTLPAEAPTAPVAALSTERSTRSAAFFRTVANLGVEAAEALEHAHQSGVIHRDIKPGNLMVDPGGRLWVTDFGLARLGDDAGLTMTGDLLGTLRYMSPEQALAKRVVIDHRTDVYSLGVTLYELLTLEPAYSGRSREEVLRQIAFEEPQSPRHLNRTVPFEMETIVLKAMAKEPGERYATAQELADDLRRFLEDKPIQARRPTLWQRVRKWARRHRPVVRTASVAAVVILVLAVIGLAASNVAIRQEKAQTDAAKAQTEAAKKELEHTLYFQRIALAEREWSANNLRRVEQLLDACPADNRGWEWHYLKRLRLEGIPPLRHPATVLSAVFSPDGRWIASGSQDGKVKVWDATTGRELFNFPAHRQHVRSVAFSPDGRRLATASWDGTAKVWDFDPKRAGGDNIPLLTLSGHQARVNSVAFSPDSQRLASAGHDQTVRVWDAATGHEDLVVHGHTNSVWCVAYSPDGQYLASAGDDTTVKLWDARTGGEKLTLHGHNAPGLSVSFSRDGQWLASITGDMSKKVDSEIKVWDARTGQEVRTLRGHTGEVFCATFSPDGQRLTSAGGDETVKLWELQTGQEVLTLRGHRGQVRSVAFSPDGTRLVSASHDRTVRIWDATPLGRETGQEALALIRQPEAVRSLAFSSDSRCLASAGDDETVRVWDFKRGLAGVVSPLIHAVPGVKGARLNVAFSKDGQLLVAGGWGGHHGGRLKVWDATTWELLYTNSTMGCPVALSPDGLHLAGVGADHTIEIRGATTGQLIRPLRGHTWAIFDVAFGPNVDIPRLASASADGTVRIWDVKAGKEIICLRHTNDVRCVAFSHDGRRLASGGHDRVVKVWDTESWQPLYEQPDPTGRVQSVVFHPKHTRVLAWGSTDGTVKVWDSATKEIRTFHGHTSWVESVAFSPDGEWIASASLDGTVKIWKTPPLPEATGAADK
jgi:WD40 repeat protein/serine/threonine protein kinase